MAFKSLVDYNDEKYGNKFILQNDGDTADVIFLYRQKRDAQVAEAHYIKSAVQSGYFHCIGVGCPACAKGIRVQRKIFIPLYNIKTQQIEFWDRTTKFDAQLERDVFMNFPNPSDYVFRITRHGEPNDINTHYDIRAVAENDLISYDAIMAKFNATFPEYYDNIIKEVSASDMSKMLNNAGPNSNYEPNLPSYQITPRTKSNDIPNFDDVVGNSSIERVDDNEDDLAAPIFD